MCNVVGGGAGTEVQPMAEGKVCPHGRAGAGVALPAPRGKSGCASSLVPEPGLPARAAVLLPPPCHPSTILLCPQVQSPYGRNRW